MSIRTIVFLIIIAAISIGALVSGRPFLEMPLPGGLPIGNLLAASALCATAGAAIGLSPDGSLIRHFSVASFVVACAWLPVSAALAGNLTLNFTGVRGQVWVVLTLATNVSVLVSLALAGISRLVRRRCRGGSARDA